MFITPQGTPKLNIRDVSRHSTLNFNIVVSQGSDFRRNDLVIVGPQISRECICGNSNIHVVQAEMPPFRSDNAGQRNTPRDNTETSANQSAHVQTPISLDAQSNFPTAQRAQVQIPVAGSSVCVNAVEACAASSQTTTTTASSLAPLSVTSVTNAATVTGQVSPLTNARTESPPTVCIPPFRDSPSCADTSDEQVFNESVQQVQNNQQVPSNNQVPSTNARHMPNTSAQHVLQGTQQVPASTHKFLKNTQQLSDANDQEILACAQQMPTSAQQPLIGKQAQCTCCKLPKPPAVVSESPVSTDTYPVYSDLLTMEQLNNTEYKSTEENSNDTSRDVSNESKGIISLAKHTTSALSSISNTNPIASAANNSPLAASSTKTDVSLALTTTLTPAPNISADNIGEAADSAATKTHENLEESDGNTAKNGLCKTEAAKHMSKCQQSDELAATAEAVSKTTETQTDLGDVGPVIKTSDAAETVENQEKKPATSEAIKCIKSYTPVHTVATSSVTVPTALGQIVLLSSPIMSTRISGSVVSRGQTPGAVPYICKSPPDRLLPVVSGYASFSCSSVEPSVVKLQPVPDGTLFANQRVMKSSCQMSSSIVSAQNEPRTITHASVIAPLLPTQSQMPVYAQVIKAKKNHTTLSVQPNLKSSSSAAVMSNTVTSDIIHSSQVTMSTSISHSHDANVSPRNKKKHRRMAPAAPDVPCANISLHSKQFPRVCESHYMELEELQNISIANGNCKPPPKPVQTPEKSTEELMQEVLMNKPQVGNLVLVKKTQSQHPPNTPKILRKSRNPSVTQRRSVIKGEERKRLTKSVESTEDVALDLDIALEFERRKNYRTSFIGDIVPSEAAKERMIEDNSFGDVQTIMQHPKKEPIYALPQPACFGDDTMQAVKRITEKYNTPQRWKLQAKSFESSLQRPTKVTMAGKGNSTTQQPHVVTATPPSISTPYTREKARLGLFYRSHAAEICICDCLAELKQRSGPNEPWLATHTGRPLLVFNTGEGRRRRQLQLVLADSTTALPLWSDFITYLSEFRPADLLKSSRPIHQLRLSSNLRVQVLIEYYNSRAAEEFYGRFLAITADPSDSLWMVSGDRSSLNTKTATKKKLINNKSIISHPCHFTHVTHMQAMGIPEELDSEVPFVINRVRSRSSEQLN